MHSPGRELDCIALKTRGTKRQYVSASVLCFKSCTLFLPGMAVSLLLSSSKIRTSSCFSDGLSNEMCATDRAAANTHAAAVPEGRCGRRSP